jgi:hypothetical protein
MAHWGLSRQKKTNPVFDLNTFITMIKILNTLYLLVAGVRIA